MVFNISTTTTNNLAVVAVVAVLLVSVITDHYDRHPFQLLTTTPFIARKSHCPFLLTDHLYTAHCTAQTDGSFLHCPHGRITSALPNTDGRITSALPIRTAGSLQHCPYGRTDHFFTAHTDLRRILRPGQGIATEKSSAQSDRIAIHLTHLTLF